MIIKGSKGKESLVEFEKKLQMIMRHVLFVIVFISTILLCCWAFIDILTDVLGWFGRFVAIILSLYFLIILTFTFRNKIISKSLISRTEGNKKDHKKK